MEASVKPEWREVERGGVGVSWAIAKKKLAHKDNRETTFMHNKPKVIGEKKSFHKQRTEVKDSSSSKNNNKMVHPLL